MFIVSVIVSKVAQLSHLQFLHQMFNVSTLLLEDALKPATPLTDGAINETHFMGQMLRSTERIFVLSLK